MRQPRRCQRIGRGTLWLLAVALFVSLPAAAQNAAAARPAEKLTVAGLPNLGKIHENLYRGGQPEGGADAYRKLKAMGIEIVVNFRNDSDDVEAERAQVEALGMRFVSIPWSGFRHPDNRQVAEFLQLLRANRDKKIFVHCRRGAERTGVMVAAYRISAQGWTPEQALEEMEAFKFRGFWFRHLKNYVRQFPKLWGSDPAFASLRAAAAGSPQ